MWKSKLAQDCSDKLLYFLHIDLEGQVHTLGWECIQRAWRGSEYRWGRCENRCLRQELRVGDQEYPNFPKLQQEFSSYHTPVQGQSVQHPYWVPQKPEGGEHVPLCALYSVLILSQAHQLILAEHKKKCSNVIEIPDGNFNKVALLCFKC